jgi:hypothetical protein
MYRLWIKNVLEVQLIKKIENIYLLYSTLIAYNIILMKIYMYYMCIFEAYIKRIYQNIIELQNEDFCIKYQDW